MLSSSSVVFFFITNHINHNPYHTYPLYRRDKIVNVAFAMDRYSTNVTLNPTWTPASSKEHNLDTARLCLITAYLRKKHYGTYQSR